MKVDRLTGTSLETLSTDLYYLSPSQIHQSIEKIQIIISLIIEGNKVNHTKLFSEKIGNRIHREAVEMLLNQLKDDISKNEVNDKDLATKAFSLISTNINLFGPES